MDDLELTVPIAVPPSPVVTEAVSVTVPPWIEGFGATASRVVERARSTTWVTTGELEP